jgi:hypothetical protein
MPFCWIPVSIVRQVHPGLVTNFEAVQEKNVCEARVSDVAQGRRKSRTYASRGIKNRRSNAESLTSPVRVARTHCRTNQGDERSRNQGSPFYAFGSDREGSRAELHSQSGLDDSALSLSSHSADAFRLDAHPSGGGFFPAMEILWGQSCRMRKIQARCPRTGLISLSTRPWNLMKSPLQLGGTSS